MKSSTIEPMLLFPASTSQTYAGINKNFNRVVLHSINILKNSSSQHVWLLGTHFKVGEYAAFFGIAFTDLRYICLKMT